MEIIRRETDYALRCLLRLGRLEGKDLESVKALSEAENIPYELLRKVFQRMTKAGLVHSVRGKQGGFRLAVSLDKITFRDVLEAVQGSVVMNRCLNENHTCPNEPSCNFHRGICEMQNRINDLLESATLSDYL